MAKEYDVFIVGGGINGVGIARDLAGRGVKVMLCEQYDLAQGTSSRSGKLIHGGLRYLEYYEFSLVRQALKEREVLLNMAPHIIWQLRFILPHIPNNRPAWLIRLGLFLYDNLGKRKKLASSHSIDLTKEVEGNIINDTYKKGFSYSDCWVDDSRLVILNALDAQEKGALIALRTKCVHAKRIKNRWHIDVQDTGTGKIETVYAKVLVNAGGAWVNNIIQNVAKSESKHNIRLVQGSHIVIPKFWQGEHAYLIQHTDKRVIFINPYEDNMALVGTTDTPYDGAIEDVEITHTEQQYLIDIINRYFKHYITPNDIISTFSGVRPLYEDYVNNPSAVTRDYVIDMDVKNKIPMLSIFGGKITTYRKLSECVVEHIKPYLPSCTGKWTHAVPLPGGDMPNHDFESYMIESRKKYPWLEYTLLKHYARLYGTRMDTMLKKATCMADLGTYFGGFLYEIEVEYLYKNEWGFSAEDILCRRTKHILHLSDAEKTIFEEWFAKVYIIKGAVLDN